MDHMTCFSLSKSPKPVCRRWVGWVGLLALSIVCGFGAGCEDDSPPVVFVDADSMEDTATDAEEPLDAIADSLDAPTDSRMSRDLDSGEDTSKPDTGYCEPYSAPSCRRCNQPLEYPAYLCKNTPGDYIEYPSFDSEFQMPDRGAEPKSTCQIVDAVGKQTSVVGSTSAPKHTNECVVPFNLYAEPGSDVTFHYGLVIPEEDFKDDVKVIASTFVDYQAVEAEVHLRSPDRDKILEQWTSKAVSFRTNDQGIQLDVTFPSSLFDEARYYEGALSIQVVNSEYVVHTVSKRLGIYYGSYQFKRRPCYEEPEDLGWTETHNKIRSKSPFARGGIGLRERNGKPKVAPSTMTAKPGEPLEFTYYAFNSNNLGYPKIFVGVPLLDGEVVASARTFVDPEGGREPAVLGKRDFSFNAPKEPGVYHLVVTGFVDPYLIERNPDACPYKGIKYTSNRAGSQIIKIRVESE
jgi:hypothetical protein